MTDMNMIEIGARLGIFFVPFLFALCFHEFAHAFVAKMKGDRTAEFSGRLTLNPMAHADPIGTWVLPIMAIVLSSPFFFGWARPVPVNPRNLNHRMDMFWISLAGPMSNVLLALVATVILALLFAYSSSSALVQLMKTFISINLFLAVFNLIPIHPLDGGKIVEPFLPARWNLWLLENQNTLSIFLLVFILMAGHMLAVPVLWASSLLMHLSVQIAHFFV